MCEICDFLVTRMYSAPCKILSILLPNAFLGLRRKKLYMGDTTVRKASSRGLALKMLPLIIYKRFSVAWVPIVTSKRSFGCRSRRYTCAQPNAAFLCLLSNFSLFLALGFYLMSESEWYSFIKVQACIVKDGALH